MAKIEDIKKLRAMTGAGMMEIKKALDFSKDDLQKAIKWLRENGISKAAKTADRIAAEGLIFIANTKAKIVILELNSETDFVAKNKLFTNFGEKIANVILNSTLKSNDLDGLLNLDFSKDNNVKAELLNTTSKIGEKINIRRFLVIDLNGNSFSSYLHANKKIGTLIIGKDISQDILKDISMQIAAMSPEFLTLKEIPKEKLLEEEKIAKKDLAATLKGKPEAVQQNIIKGKINKNLSEIVLEEQVFVKDNTKKVKNLLGKTGKLITFVRYEVGEGIIQKENDFAKEVKEQVKKAKK